MWWRGSGLPYGGATYEEECGESTSSESRALSKDLFSIKEIPRLCGRVHHLYIGPRPSTVDYQNPMNRSSLSLILLGQKFFHIRTFLNRTQEESAPCSGNNLASKQLRHCPPPRSSSSSRVKLIDLRLYLGLKINISGGSLLKIGFLLLSPSSSLKCQRSSTLCCGEPQGSLESTAPTTWPSTIPLAAREA